MDFSDESYYCDAVKGFEIHLGEEVTPRQVNLLVLKKFLAQLPKSECIEYVRRKNDKVIYVKICPQDHLSKFWRKIDKCDKIDGHPVEIVIPPLLRFQVRKISHPELRYLEPAELKELLNVPTLQYIDIKQQAATAILGFDLPGDEVPPSTLLLGWDTVKCKELRPLPLRCHNCQKYGHRASDCRSSSICPRCSQEGHSRTTCDATTPTCPACGGPHEVSCTSCPVWKKKKENKMSYAAMTKKEPANKTTPPPDTTPASTSPNNNDHSTDSSSSEETIDVTNQDTPPSQNMETPEVTPKRPSSDDDWKVVTTKKKKPANNEIQQRTTMSLDQNNKE